MARIEYVHASKFGNGAQVATEFQRAMVDRGVDVAIHHVREVSPKALAPADLYVFSSPGRLGRPIRSIRRFLKALELAEGTPYALLTTEMQPRPDKKTGLMPNEEEIRASGQKVRPIMNELLEGKGLDKVGEEWVYVTGLKGPLAEGWQSKVDAFADRLPVRSSGRSR
jgi:hypothetical protein